MSDLTRREVLRFGALVVGAAPLAGCGGSDTPASDLPTKPLGGTGTEGPGTAPPPPPATPAPPPPAAPAPAPAPAPIAESAVPAWRKGQAVNEWREIAGSAMTLLAPTNEARTFSGGRAIVGPSARMNAWCGLSIDTRSSEVWSVANGGHGDYYGNEVCTIDLMADAPAWAEWFAGSNGNVVDDVLQSTDPARSRYADGRPVSTHSYYGQQFLERQDRAIRLGGSSAPRGSAFENVEGFDVGLVPGTNGWDAAGIFGFCVGGINRGWTPAIAWSACKDPTTECIYVMSAPRIHRFTPASLGLGGNWSVLGMLPQSMNSGAMGATAVDTRRNRIMWVKGYGPKHPMVCDLATGGWTGVAGWPASAARSELEAMFASPGMVYVPQLDAFLVRGKNPGSKVLRVDAGDFSVAHLATTGGEGVPIGAQLAVGSPSEEEGVYNRWLYVPALSGVVYFPRAESNAWFLRLY